MVCLITRHFLLRKNLNNPQNIIPRAYSKNLFLKDKKQNFFVSVINHKRVDLNLYPRHSVKVVSFANEDELFTLLKLTPGAMTPYGLINNPSVIGFEVGDRSV